MMTRAEIEQVFSVAFAAAKANVYVQQWQKEFPELWGDEQLARNVPLRVEFEQVYVFGTVAEAVSWAGGFGGDTGTGRNKRGWGSIVRVDPLESDDPVDAKRVTCVHKESSPFRQRLEARRQIKRMMRESSPLVQLARRFSKRDFLKYYVTPDHRRAIRAYTGLDPGKFWQHVRRGIPIPELQGHLFGSNNK
jgi:hypothetical protein